MSETGTIIFALVVLLGAVAGAAFLTWFERRLLGIWQDRYGPNRLGPFGVYQVLADMLKLLTKHDWVPPFSDRVVFVFAPASLVVAMMMGFAVVPFSEQFYIIDINIGLLFFLGMTSLAVYAVLLGGLASNNKYALLGGLRGAAQMVQRWRSCDCEWKHSRMRQRKDSMYPWIWFQIGPETNCAFSSLDPRPEL